MKSKTQINTCYRSKTKQNKNKESGKGEEIIKEKNTRKCSTHRYELPILKGPIERSSQ